MTQKRKCLNLVSLIWNKKWYVYHRSVCLRKRMVWWALCEGILFNKRLIHRVYFVTTGVIQGINVLFVLFCHIRRVRLCVNLVHFAWKQRQQTPRARRVCQHKVSLNWNQWMKDIWLGEWDPTHTISHHSQTRSMSVCNQFSA